MGVYADNGEGERQWLKSVRSLRTNVYGLFNERWREPSRTGIDNFAVPHLGAHMRRDHIVTLTPGSNRIMFSLCFIGVHVRHDMEMRFLPLLLMLVFTNLGCMCTEGFRTIAVSQA